MLICAKTYQAAVTASIHKRAPNHFVAFDEIIRTNAGCFAAPLDGQLRLAKRIIKSHVIANLVEHDSNVGRAGERKLMVGGLRHVRLAVSHRDENGKIGPADHLVRLTSCDASVDDEEIIALPQRVEHFCQQVRGRDILIGQSKR